MNKIKFIPQFGRNRIEEALALSKEKRGSPLYDVPMTREAGKLERKRRQKVALREK